MSVGLVNPDVAKKGGLIARAMMEGGAAGWSTLIGKNVGYAVTAADYGRADEVVRPEEAGLTLVTPVKLSGDAQGSVYLLVPARGAKEIVAQMTALMLGGDPNPETQQLDRDGMDGYTEAVNNFFGQAAQQMRGELGGAVKIAVGGTSMVDFHDGNPADVLGGDEFLFNKVKITIDGRPPFLLELLMSRSVTGVPPEQQGDLPAVGAADSGGVAAANLAIAMKIRLPVVVGIAVKKMRMELIQNLAPGSIIEFKKMSGENLDVMASNIKIATAEAVIINQCFGVQIRSIVDPQATAKD